MYSFYRTEPRCAANPSSHVVVVSGPGPGFLPTHILHIRHIRHIMVDHSVDCRHRMTIPRGTVGDSEL